jgi:hypothetical protein
MRASQLLGGGAGIETDPYGLPSHQGTEPPEDAAAKIEWAQEVCRWYRFKPGTGDYRIWRLYSQGYSVREIGRVVNLDWSNVARRIRHLTGEIKAAEERRAERPRRLEGMAAQCDPLFLVSVLAKLHG